jgi:hypothetical protein
MDTNLVIAFSQTIAELKTRLDDATEKSDHYAQQTRECCKTIDNLKQTEVDFRQRVDELKQDIDDLQQDKADLLQRVNNLHDENLRLLGITSPGTDTDNKARLFDWAIKNPNDFGKCVEYMLPFPPEGELNKIRQIKDIRMIMCSGAGLKEAKDFVELWYKSKSSVEG